MNFHIYIYIYIGNNHPSWLSYIHFLFFHKLGISSSQVTFTHIFQRGRAQPPTRHHHECSAYPASSTPSCWTLTDVFWHIQATRAQPRILGVPWCNKRGLCFSRILGMIISIHIRLSFISQFLLGQYDPFGISIIWVNLITTSLFSRTLGIMVYFRGIIPSNGPTIQDSEILFHLPSIL